MSKPANNQVLADYALLGTLSNHQQSKSINNALLAASRGGLNSKVTVGSLLLHLTCAQDLPHLTRHVM